MSEIEQYDGPTTNVIPMPQACSTELVTRVAFLNDKGKIESVSEKEFESLVADANTENAKIEAENSARGADSPDLKEPVAVPTALRSLSFVKYAALTDEGFAQLVPSPEQRMKEVKRALDIKQNQYIRDIMTSDDTEFANFLAKNGEGAVDLAEVVAKPTERKAASPEDKLKKLLGELSVETIQAILAQAMADKAGASA
jgi:DNA polymerase I-like protein with 3'-5' exonuclease and polymerase domains